MGGDCLASCMRMAWFRMANRRKNRGQLWDIFVEVCRRRGLHFNADKSKVMVMNGEEGLECEVYE